MSVNILLQDSLSFSSPLLLLCVLQRKLQFRPELGVSAAQSLQQQTCLLMKLLQLALGALIFLDQLLCAHCDPQQSRFVENIVGITETFQFVIFHRGAMPISMHCVVNLCPEFICVGGLGRGSCQQGERIVLKLGCLCLAGCFKVGDGLDGSVQHWLRAGGTVGSVATAVPPLPLVID